MSRQDRRPETPSLFDLPLGPSAAESEAAAAPRRSARTERPAPPAPEALPLFAPEVDAGAARADAARRGASRDDRRLHAVPPPSPAERGPRAGFARRMLGGLGDLALQAAVYVLMLAGARLLGSEITPAALAPAGIALLLFSLLYTVLPLAFWGQTPGMSWAGIVSRSADGEPLSFGQSFRMWLAGLLSLLLVGLPTLIAPRGRSLCDRIAGARTLPASA